MSLKSPRSLIIMAIFCSCLSADGVLAAEHRREKIVYAISPVGRAEYNDLGEAEINGQKVNVVTFRTQAIGFADTEKIYSDPQSYLPVKVERDVSMWLGKEYLVEQYDQNKFLLTIDKFKAGKKVKQYIFQKDGPIYNAVLLPFHLRSMADLEIGWKMQARFPDEFTIRLVSFDEITVPAGKFMTYHFTSSPSKFEIWISRDEPRVPVKIKGLGGLGYTMVMREYALSDMQTEEVK